MENAGKSDNTKSERYLTTLIYIGLSLLAAVGENILFAFVYKCPCNGWNLLYSLIFILAPAMVFFVLGFILNEDIWTKAACCSVSDCRMVVLRVTFFSSLAPLIWISMALLKDTYYECMVSGSPWKYMKEEFCKSNHACIEEILLLPCASTVNLNFSKTAIEDIQKHLKTETQVLGWIAISCVLIGMIFLCIKIIIQTVSTEPQPNEQSNFPSNEEVIQSMAQEQDVV